MIGGIEVLLNGLSLAKQKISNRTILLQIENLFGFCTNASNYCHLTNPLSFSPDNTGLLVVKFHTYDKNTDKENEKKQVPVWNNPGW
jgi:hypothetical protein